MASVLNKKERKRHSSRDLTPAQNDAIRAIIRDVLLPKFKNQEALAKELDMGQPALSGFLNRRAGTSLVVALRVATLANVDPASELGIQVAKEDDLSEVERARRAAMLLKYEEADIEAGLSTPTGSELSCRKWFSLIHAAERRRLDPLGDYDASPHKAAVATGSEPPTSSGLRPSPRRSARPTIPEEEAPVARRSLRPKRS